MLTIIVNSKKNRRTRVEKEIGNLDQGKNIDY